MRVLSFEWSLSYPVSSKEEITNEVTEKQMETLRQMVVILDKKIKSKLNNVEIVKCKVKNCSGLNSKFFNNNVSKKRNISKYQVKHILFINIAKKGRKSTWKEVCETVESIQKTEFSFINTDK
ncbi:hypothetical protein [Clostridioides difficile]|uniref:hypothetical protein n=1 Tax=Clostridioides difficile TaxID=1496 RepID=UPI000D1FB901|nr:hypothetical protein [Clostridioides difficile]HBE9444607.1 hypothetical protein [Clostridioides difficile]